MYIYRHSLRLSIHPRLKLSLGNPASCNTSYFTSLVLAIKGPTPLLLSWPLLELSLPYRAAKFLQSTYSSAVLFQTDSITAIEPPCDRYRYLLLLLFIFSPTSSRNPYAHTVSSSRLRKCIEHSPFCSTVGERTMANPPPEIWL